MFANFEANVLHTQTGALIYASFKYQPVVLVTVYLFSVIDKNV